MEITEADRNTYQQLMRKPISLWIVFPCSFALITAISAAKAYLGWEWVALVEDLPFLLMIIFTLISFLVTPYQNLLRKLACIHPELVSETNANDT